MDGYVTYGLLYISPFWLWAVAALLSSALVTLTALSYKVVLRHISAERMLAFIRIPPLPFAGCCHFYCIPCSPAVDSDAAGGLWCHSIVCVSGRKDSALYREVLLEFHLQLIVIHFSYSAQLLSFKGVRLHKLHKQNTHFLTQSCKQF